MKAGALPFRARPRPICQLCDYILQHQPAPRRSFFAAPTGKAPLIRRQPARRHGLLPRMPARGIASTPESPERGPEIASPQQPSDRISALKAKLAEVEKHIDFIYSSPKVESEAAVLQVLATLEAIARQAIAIRTGQPPPSKINIRQSSAGAILSLNRDENVAASNGKKTSKPKASFFDELPTPTYLSRLAEDLLKNEKVFISPAVLSAYVDLQRLLDRPRAIPEIFHLYANKPVPELGSSPPKFSTPSPKAAKQAIPPEVAEKALSAAIAAKDLSLALSIVDTTYCAPAWQRYTILKKVVPPGILVTITPLALYMIAQELSVYSSYIDPWTFKMYSFAGLLTYVTCTGTLGFVAMTTHNDHFERVVWRPGMPLVDRWLREDERAALDRIACAWGFKEVWKRGDEEGEEWEGLREWIGLRDMILDKPDLMEGMNP